MPVIAISRGSYSGGRELAAELSDRLGWSVVGQDEVGVAARKYGVSAEELVKALDHPAHFFGTFAQRKRRYILVSQAVLAEKFADGNGIFHGLGGALLLKDFCNAYRVLLIAPLDMRLAALTRREKLPREQAERRIREEDERRLRWGRQMFGRDWDNPDDFDIVVDLANTDLASAADSIAGEIGSGKYKPTPDCVRDFRDMALAIRVRAALFFNSPFPHDIVEVSTTESSVHLHGGKAFASQQRAVVDWVRSIPGVEKVTTNLDDEMVIGSGESFSPGITNRETKAWQVMLPPENYPHVHQDVSIRDAMVAIGASAVKLEDGFFLSPRYILILDDAGRLVGIVSRRELLEGLVPQLRDSRASERHIRELVPFAGETPDEIVVSWTSLFTERAVVESRQPVRTVMRPVRATVNVEDSLSNVITTMLLRGVDLLPVLDGERVAGVVVMTNIFDVVAQFIMESGGKGE
jgi:CBS domain-containing protein